MDDRENQKNPDNPNDDPDYEVNEDQRARDEPESRNKGEHGYEGEDREGDWQAEDEQTDVEQEVAEGAEPRVSDKEVGEEVDEEVANEDQGGENLAEEQMGEGNAEELEGEQEEEEKEKKEEQPFEEQVEEEEGYVEEPPPDPAAPFDFSDSKEALRPLFELRPDQVAEVEQLWEVYQNYTPAYSDLDGWITETELIYMLKSLLLMTYTPEQLQELIVFCVKPPHPLGHILYDQFLKMVTLRQREILIEDELRSALQVLDPDNTGSIDREVFRELLAKQGHKMPPKQLDNLIKEVDLSNDGTVGIEDVIGTMCIDLNKEDILMLRAAIFPDENPPQAAESTEF